MADAFARARAHVAPLDTLGVMRALVVCGCALALALAGPILPF